MSVYSTDHFMIFIGVYLKLDLVYTMDVIHRGYHLDESLDILSAV